MANWQQVREQVAYQNYRNETIQNQYQQGANASSYANINGRSVRLNELTDEEWEELMGIEEEEEEIYKSGQEYSSKNSDIIRANSDYMDAEYLAYMSYMETKSQREDNYM